jgi:oxygen-dependent protoporphyrinogen oxidase
MPHVVIAGGGLTGLTVAFHLRSLAPRTTVTVLEPGGRPGGNIGTEEHDGFRVERGPNGFLDRTPFLPKLIDDLDLSGKLIAASEGSRKNRFLYLRGKLRPLPRGPFGLATSSLLSLRGKWQLLCELWRGRAPNVPGDESIAQFVTRRAGREAADVLADALVTGIHGGDPAELSVAATFPRLPLMERQAGSIIRGFARSARERKRAAVARGEPPPGPFRMWSFREGLGVLVGALADALGPALRCGDAVERITPAGTRWQIATRDGRLAADAVVLACPAYAQAEIVSGLDPAMARDMAAIPYNRIAVVALGYRQSDCPIAPAGFGYIAPQNTRRDVLGVQWCSAIFPDRAARGCVLWRALCGGVHRGELLDLADEELARAVHAEIRLAMKVRGEPVFRRIIRWRRAIPQYIIGHLDRVARIEAAAARFPGLYLTGNAYRGVAMGDCAEQGALVAARLAADLSAGSQRDSHA